MLRDYSYAWEIGFVMVKFHVFSWLSCAAQLFDRSKSNYLNSHLKKPEKEEQRKPNINRRKKIIKSRNQ